MFSKSCAPLLGCWCYIALCSQWTKVLHVTAHFQYYMHNNFTVAHSNALNFLILVNKLFTNKMVKKIEASIEKKMYNTPILSLSEIHCSCLDHLLSDFCPLLFTHFRCLINFLHDILNITYHKYWYFSVNHKFKLTMHCWGHEYTL